MSLSQAIYKVKAIARFKGNGFHFIYGDYIDMSYIKHLTRMLLYSSSKAEAIMYKERMEM